MAGSYNHCINHEGKLLDPESLNDMLENGGDVYEAVEEMYGMIWWLAQGLAYEEREDDIASIVEMARQNYRHGIEFSPGVVEE